ncbi:MAG TPA: dephospho-CoA kinase [Polyangiaceae bacterium]|nr:dephospho-CoA kinase [Polyangiaceae bacterium]
MGRVFGLTGGIASGKTTVARRIEELGIPVVYADELAREAVAKGSPGLEAIVATFGEGVLDATGELDRKKLGAVVFADEAARKKLNAIVHPRVAALGFERFSKLFGQGHALVCYEVPLLVENGLADMFRPVVVVAAPEEVQIERTMKRDGLDREAARQRVHSQLPLADKVAVADYVIENTGDEADLVQRVDAVVAAIRRSLAPAPG